MNTQEQAMAPSEEEEDRRIIGMIRQGISTLEIAEKLGTPGDTTRVMEAWDRAARAARKVMEAPGMTSEEMDSCEEEMTRDELDCPPPLGSADDDDAEYGP